MRETLSHRAAGVLAGGPVASFNIYEPNVTHLYIHMKLEICYNLL